jgi:integrase
MTDQVISPLRRRMIEDMAIRKFASKTQHDYVQRVKDFAAFLGRSPDTAKSEDVRGFRLHLASSGAGTPKINATVSALRFFFKVTLDRPELAKHLAFMHEPRKVPVVLSPEEVARFLEATPSIKYKAALSVAYGAGLRVSEVVSLKVSDIDSERMMLRVEQGKGRKDRHAKLSPELLSLLRAWWLQWESPKCQQDLDDRMRLNNWSIAASREPGQPDDDAPAYAGLPRRGPHGRDYQACDATHLAPQLRDPPARAEHRYSGDPSPARACQARHHGAVHARRHQHHPRGHEPAGPPHAADGQEE